MVEARSLETFQNASSPLVSFERESLVSHLVDWNLMERRRCDGQGRNSDCIVSTIQYVRHNRFVDCNQPTEACFQRISQHPLDPRTTFRQITPIPLIEYISIHQRRVSQPCVTFVRYTGENQKQYFSPNRPSAAPERE